MKWPRLLLPALGVVAALAAAGAGAVAVRAGSPPPVPAGVDPIYLIVGGKGSGPNVRVGSVFSPVGGRTAKAIAISGFSLGVAVQAALGGQATGLKAGKPKLGDLSVTKVMDANSPALFQLAVAGRAIPSLELVMTSVPRLQTGLKTVPRVYATLAFHDVVVTSLDWHESGGGQPQESITFAYGAVQLSYEGSTANGGGPASTATWNRVYNNNSFDLQTQTTK